MRILQRIIFTIIGSVFCVGCQAKIDRADLVGVYRADSGTYPDVIDVRDNGSYVHSYHLNPQGVEITTTNKWTCETNDGVMRITFEEFVWGVDFVQPNLSKAKREGPSFWDVEVERSFGKLRLRINSDVRQFYVKVSNVSPTP
jgi:hypothetical protein